MSVNIFNDGISDCIGTEDASVFHRISNNNRQPMVAIVPLHAVDTGGGIFSWKNPEAGSIIITRVVLDVTTVATGACAVDVGTTASSGTTSSDNLLDGIDVHTAAGLFSAADGDATNAKAQQKLASGKWVTGSKASGASAGLVGNCYIYYHHA